MTSKRDAIKGESMGFRIRKSISLGKGIRVNLGKNGISSVTFGKRGAPHVTVGKRGTYVGASIPGTGISYSQKISDEKARQGEESQEEHKTIQSGCCTTAADHFASGNHRHAISFRCGQADFDQHSVCLNQRAFKLQRANRPSNRWKTYEKVQAARLLETVDRHYSRCRRSARHRQHEC